LFGICLAFFIANLLRRKPGEREERKKEDMKFGRVHIYKKHCESASVVSFGK
jgi:hypothetical protein